MLIQHVRQCQPLPRHLHECGGILLQDARSGQPAEKNAQMHHFHAHGTARHAAGLQVPEKFCQASYVHPGRVGIPFPQKPGKLFQGLPDRDLVGGAQPFFRSQKADETFYVSLHAESSFFVPSLKAFHQKQELRHILGTVLQIPASPEGGVRRFQRGDVSQPGQESRHFLITDETFRTVGQQNEFGRTGFQQMEQ